MKKRILSAAAVLGLVCASLGAGAPNDRPDQAAAKPTLYIISNSHLDTQWNWTVQDTIRDLVPRTFFDNFKLFETYTNYVFNYEGAIHYMWFKEYYPEEWARVQKYVDAGRWKLSGGWINAADTHVPSPEALMRQALYGKGFFRREFGRVPQDVYLPDCFGFGYALPATAAHSGLTAFSTQKLSWGAATPPPFAVGRWKGVDGSTLIASIRAGDYVKEIRSDVSVDPKWNGDLADIGGGDQVGFRYFGVGDQGGAPDVESVGWLEKAMANVNGAVRVRNTSADQLSRDLTPAQKAALPEYEGEFLLKTHGVGCFTSQAAMKNWNRKNELLADAAERASLAAEWLGGPAYPREELRAAWIRFLWHQFHDDLTGTSIPQAYRFSWNDELLSLNQFAGITAGAVGAVASGLDTRGTGVPLVVFNPLAMTRRDPVEALVRFEPAAPAEVRVVDAATGKDVPAQVLSVEGKSARILFLADMPPIGFKVFNVRPGTSALRSASVLKVTGSTLENERYAVKLNADGDVASVLDRETGKELLGGPARLELLSDVSARWPAWEITWTEISKPARAYAGSPRVRIVERGPVRVALEVARTGDNSAFVQRLSLAAGGDRLDFETSVDWKSTGTLLKASFPLTASNAKATYDLGLGTIERPTARENLYEVPGQQWADLTDKSGGYGAAVFNDGKYGWDKPADSIVRLTLIHTPKPGKSYVYQSSNDIGRHHFIYAIAGHAGDWRTGCIPARAARLNQPLLAFQTGPHAGTLGRSLSMLTVHPDGGQVAVRAFKKAEDSEEIVLRVQELYGQPAAGVQIALPAAIASAREVNAAEEPVGPVDTADGRLALNLARYQTRTFLLHLAAGAAAKLARPVSTPLALPFDIDGLSADAGRGDGDFDGRGTTIPAELFPASLTVDGVVFQLGPGHPGAKNVLAAAGQRIALPAGGATRLHFLAAAVGLDVPGTFSFERAGAPDVRVPVTIDEWEGAVGQWDSRLTDDRLLREEFLVDTLKDQEWPLPTVQAQMAVWADASGILQGLDRLQPAFAKRDRIAWVATHRHTPKGNEAYSPAYLFRYILDLPAGATAVVLPVNGRIRVFAMTATKGDYAGTVAAGELYAPDIPRRAPAAAR